MKKPRSPSRRRKTATAGPSLPPHGIRSISIGVLLLRTIAASRHPMKLNEIAQSAKISASRANRYLLGLIANKLVVRNAITGLYDLGPEILALGIAALGRVDIIRFGIDALPVLTETTQLASAMGVWGTNGPTVVRWEQGYLSSAVRIREGRNLSLLRSSMGRVFLAYYPSNITKPFIEREMAEWNKSHSDSAAYTWDKVEDLRKRIRRSGLARGLGEENPHLDGLAAPVFDVYQRLAYVIALISMRGSFALGDQDPPAIALRSITLDLSHNSGAPPAPNHGDRDASMRPR